MDATQFISHISCSDGARRERILVDHLEGTAKRAEAFAYIFGSADWGRLVGRWHDLGKFRPAFQRYLRKETGCDDGAFADASLARTEHSIVGAIHAVERLGGGAGRVLAYLIAGHHAGLTDWYTEKAGGGSLKVRLDGGRELYDEVTMLSEAVETLSGAPPTSQASSADALALWIRMLFSCLVDADFLDTESFLNPDQTDARIGFEDLGALKREFDRHMEELEAETRGHGDLSSVNRVRSRVLQNCRARAELEPGLFSLTVPTGGGKTLSSMAFALEHAIEYRKSRIIYVIPYTSIIEQTADVFRGIFGDAVVEHHSNLEGEDSEKVTPAHLRARLATENWDAPIVVTTAVQFFESLFAARTSRVRKLHNIANSVVVLDEAQLLPPDFLAPILQAIDQLSRHFGVTILLMTATQPALEDRQEEDFHFHGLNDVREIVDNPGELHRTLRRVEISVPDDLQTPRDWEELRDELLDQESVLCIVNTRRDCRALWRLLEREDPEAIHLSALMCGAHRTDVIRRMRARLDAGIPTRVISTQLIEAGVDVDFPVVYRALAGLDSIAQAAGRCNREGRLDAGQVVIFVPPRPAPAGHLQMAEACGRQLLAEHGEDPLDPDRFTRFFEDLYWKYGPNLDRYRIVDDLATRPKLDFRFRTAASKFRIIDDSQQVSVVVRYGEGIEELLYTLRHAGPSRSLLRRLQRRIVNVSHWHLKPMLHAGVVEEVHPGVFVQEDTAAYNDKEGFLIDLDEIRNPETLQV